MSTPCDQIVTTTVTGRTGSIITVCSQVRNPAKDKLTETTEHYIAAKRPYELAVLRNAIPATEWNTLDDVVAS